MAFVQSVENNRCKLENRLKNPETIKVFVKSFGKKLHTTTINKSMSIASFKQRVEDLGIIYPFRKRHIYLYNGKMPNDDQYLCEFEEYSTFHVFVRWSEIHECNVCYEDILNKDPYITKCKHMFCEECIYNWSKACIEQDKGPTCPMCRTFII